jgi:membrane-associated phospholipid phosphatase
MSDPIPSQEYRFAVVVGRILHPYWMPIPTLLAILSDLPTSEALKWSIIVLAITLLPGMIAAAFFQNQGHALYKRKIRGPLYLVGWLSVLACLVVVLQFDAPRVLVACVATLAVWLPVQWGVNHWVTKVSAHAAVATGCLVALVLLGKVANPILGVILLVLVIVTLWARVVTRNHTIPQVLLGVLIGALPVLIVFPLALS